MTSGTAVTDLMPRSWVMPSRTRTVTVRLPGSSAVSSSSSGWDGSGAWDTAPPPADQPSTLRLPHGRTR